MDPVILSRVQDKLFSMRVRAEAEQAERRAEIYEKVPRIAELDASLGSTAAQLLRTALDNGSDPVEKLAELRTRSVDIRLERERLLERAGYPLDALDVHHSCEKCGDMGILPSGAMCSCLLKMYSDEQLAELEKYLPVRKASFETFDETVYPDTPFRNREETPRANARVVRDFCRELAVAPHPERSIFIYGDVGVGKTFLAAATAAAASKIGKSVACRSMSELVTLFERNKFTRDDDIRESSQSEIDRLLACDLLIIDDFGSEFHAPFADTVAISLFTARRRAGLPLMICSSLGSRTDLEAKYPLQVSSCLLGDEFFALLLYGPDLRRAGI